MSEPEEEKTYEVLFLWDGVSPDPAQYKPYSPHFQPVNTIVALDVPARYVAEPDVEMYDEHYIVLTPDGMAWCSQQLSAGIANIRKGL